MHIIFTNIRLHKEREKIKVVNALVICCPQKELGCIIIVSGRENWGSYIQGHLSPGAVVSPSEGCAYVVVPYAYQCGAQLQRRLLREHEMRSCPKQPIGKQIAHEIIHKMEDIVAENKLLRQELKEAHKKEIEDLTSFLDS